MDDQTLHIQDEILKAALVNVAFDGWTWQMVCAAADEVGHNENIARGVFPEKMVSVLDHFADWADREMLAKLVEIEPGDMRVRDRVRLCLNTRFEVLQPYKDAVRQSLQFWMWPTRKPRALKITWRLAGRIWVWSEADSANFSHYSKRGLLSGVIASTTLAWFDMSKTQAFLDRRIENVMQLGKVIQTVKSKVS